MSKEFSLPYWYDLHVHLRQDGLLPPLIAAHRAMGCAGVLAMPNTRPPIADIASITRYRKEILEAGADDFQAIIIPLYLTRDTTPAMIEDGARTGALQACKYYPPHGTTNSDFGVPLEHYISNGVFQAMQDNGIVLCIHGEEHGLEGAAYFSRTRNAEEIFYRERIPRLVEAFPSLKIVCEHITSKVAADFVTNASSHVAATITPQHILYTVGDLLMALNYHLYCKPVLKFDDDRTALLEAVMRPQQTKFFAGTDSAPHTTKATPCGCAAGCFTGAIAPQLYAMGFESGGANLDHDTDRQIFEQFLCNNGKNFYGLPDPDRRFTLTRAASPVTILPTPDGPITPLPAGLNPDHDKTGTTIPWSLQL
jgi:dihydroorotase